MSRMTTAVLAALVAIAAVLPPASAGTPRLGLSWDGHAWSPTLAGTLFGRAGAAVTWVPGDSDTQTFLVRNQSADDASLTVRYLLPASRLHTAGKLELAVRVGAGPWRNLTSGAAWTNLEITPLGAGRSMAVSVRGTFDWSSTNASQDEAAPVDFRVHLAGIQADAAAGAGHQGRAGDRSDGTAAGGLAATGAPPTGWLVGMSIVCLVGGGLLIVARRRQERDVEAS